jgi:hypothetical protein
MIQKAIGSGDWPVVVQSIRPWRMTAQVAERYCAGDGRVFLVGDAAHRFPPAGGFGECENSRSCGRNLLLWNLCCPHRRRSSSSRLGWQRPKKEKRSFREPCWNARTLSIAEIGPPKTDLLGLGKVPRLFLLVRDLTGGTLKP